MGVGGGKAGEVGMSLRGWEIGVLKKNENRPIPAANRVTFSASNGIFTNGYAATGSALCAADAAKIAAVHHGGRVLAGAGDRRQYGHLHADSSTHSGTAAGEASRRTGAADQPGPTLRQQHGPQRDFLPDVPGYPRQEPGLQRNVLQVRSDPQPELRGKNRAGVRGTGVGELLSGAGCGSGGGARVQRLRRPHPGRASAGGAELRILEDEVWRKPQRDRHQDPGERVSADDCRGEPGRLRRRGGGDLAADPHPHDDEKGNDGGGVVLQPQRPAPPFRAGVRQAQARHDTGGRQGRIAAAVPPDLADGGARERLREDHRVHQAAVSENVDGRAAGLQGPVRPAAAVHQSAVGPDGHCGAGAADCVFERGQPADRPGHGAAEGDCGAAGAGGEPAAPDLPIARGERSAFGGGRPGGAGTGGVDGPDAHRFPAARA